VLLSEFVQYNLGLCEQALDGGGGEYAAREND
jgi:hypothetical protein